MICATTGTASRFREAHEGKAGCHVRPNWWKGFRRPAFWTPDQRCTKPSLGVFVLLNLLYKRDRQKLWQRATYIDRGDLGACRRARGEKGNNQTMTAHVKVNVRLFRIRILKFIITFEAIFQEHLHIYWKAVLASVCLNLSSVNNTYFSNDIRWCNIEYLISTKTSLSSVRFLD